MLNYSAVTRLPLCFSLVEVQSSELHQRGVYILPPNLFSPSQLFPLSLPSLPFVIKSCSIPKFLSNQKHTHIFIYLFIYLCTYIYTCILIYYLFIIYLYVTQVQLIKKFLSNLQKLSKKKKIMKVCAIKQRVNLHINI